MQTQTNDDAKNLNYTGPEEELPSDEWLAGLFDGEGCISLRRVNTHRVGNDVSYALGLTVGNTKGQAAWLFSRRFGGKLHVVPAKMGKREQKFYVWNVTGREAKEALAVLQRYLVLKKDEANFALEFLCLPWRGKARTETQKEIEENYFKTIKQLKRYQGGFWWEKDLPVYGEARRGVTQTVP